MVNDQAMGPEARDVIEVVLEALDIPYAATVGHEETRQKILDHRVMQTVVVLRTVVEGRWHSQDLGEALAYLREKLAELPATGYVTDDQARERLAQGMDWAQAVALDDSAPSAAVPDPKPETPPAAGPESGGPVGDVSSPTPRHATSRVGEEATPLQKPPAQTPVSGVTGSAGDAASSAPRSAEEAATAQPSVGGGQ